MQHPVMFEDKLKFDVETERTAKVCISKLEEEFKSRKH